MKFIAIIPARYASTRFPGKPLAQINGKPMVQHVYERCSEVLEHVFVATDNQLIAEAVSKFNGKFIMTSEKHPSGTDRIAEAANIISKELDFDIVINVQGDEPFIESKQIEQLMHCFNDPSTDIATLVTPIRSEEILTDPNKVKAVIASNGKAIYFSRSAVPYVRDQKPEDWLKIGNHFLHLGMYAYKAQVLSEITKLSPSPLELMEKLEQLRWLENGYTIKTAQTAHHNFGVDTPKDLENLLKQIKKP